LKIVFLDRDGVINRDRSDYVKGWPEFEFLPGSLDALRLLTENDYHVIIITNQSVINRKMVTEEELRDIHRKMEDGVIGHGGRIKAVYYCPHVPEDGCSCRKPETGLIERAKADHRVDLSETCLIGDSLKDIQCARLAGCGKVVLVRTGHGRETEELCKHADVKPDHVADDLMAAVRWLLKTES
jgi:D-glycero-D-manno-heptose 1,7-bisphosphate phosphatase